MKQSIWCIAPNKKVNGEKEVDKRLERDDNDVD